MGLTGINSDGKELSGGRLPNPGPAPRFGNRLGKQAYLRRLRMIMNAPATNASALAPVEGSISGTDVARQLPARPIPIKTTPDSFIMVLILFFSSNLSI